MIFFYRTISSKYFSQCFSRFNNSKFSNIFKKKKIPKILIFNGFFFFTLTLIGQKWTQNHSKFFFSSHTLCKYSNLHFFLDNVIEKRGGIKSRWSRFFPCISCLSFRNKMQLLLYTLKKHSSSSLKQQKRWSFALNKVACVFRGSCFPKMRKS